MALPQLRPLAWIIPAGLALHCNTPLASPDIPVAISGYTDRLSYQPGDTLRLHLSADRSYPRAQIRLFDMAGTMIDWVTTPVEPQIAETGAPWANGFGYAATFSYILPSLPSGVYTWEQQVPFVLRPPRNGKPVLVAYPSNTAAAYSTAGGKVSITTIPARGWQPIRSPFSAPLFCRTRPWPAWTTSPHRRPEIPAFWPTPTWTILPTWRGPVCSSSSGTASIGPAGPGKISTVSWMPEAMP